jgi:hypothetical protein
MMLHVRASDRVQGEHKMYTGSRRTSLRPVLTAAHVALHRSACRRGIQVGRERDGSQVSVSGCVRVFGYVLSMCRGVECLDDVTGLRHLDDVTGGRTRWRGVGQSGGVLGGLGHLSLGFGLE